MAQYAIGCLPSLSCYHCVKPANSAPGGKAETIPGRMGGATQSNHVYNGRLCVMPSPMENKVGPYRLTIIWYVCSASTNFPGYRRDFCFRHGFEFQFVFVRGLTYNSRRWRCCRDKICTCMSVWRHVHNTMYTAGGKGMMYDAWIRKKGKGPGGKWRALHCLSWVNPCCVFLT